MGRAAGASAVVEKSKRRVERRETAAWRVQEFSVTAGGGAGEAWRVAAVVGPTALLVWVGGRGAAAAALGAVALGVPEAARRALSTQLAGGAGAAGEAAAALARRLAARLARPVHVCCAAELDRFSAPLLEAALLTEIASRADHF